MPNKRDKNKKNINIWINEKEYSEFTSLALDLGKTKTEILTELILEALDKRKKIPVNPSVVKSKK